MLILYYMFLTLAVVFVTCLCFIVVYGTFKAFEKNKDYDINNAIELLSEHYNVSEGYIINMLDEGRELSE